MRGEENQPMTESQDAEILMWLLVQTLELVRFFIVASPIFKLIYFFKKERLYRGMYKTDLTVYRPSKKNSPHDSVPLNIYPEACSTPY
jgi:hypothetical protein